MVRCENCFLFSFVWAGPFSGVPFRRFAYLLVFTGASISRLEAEDSSVGTPCEMCNLSDADCHPSRNGPPQPAHLWWRGRSAMWPPSGAAALFNRALALRSWCRETRRTALGHPPTLGDLPRNWCAGGRRPLTLVPTSAGVPPVRFVRRGGARALPDWQSAWTAALPTRRLPTPRSPSAPVSLPAAIPPFFFLAQPQAAPTPASSIETNHISIPFISPPLCRHGPPPHRRSHHPRGTHRRRSRRCRGGGVCRVLPPPPAAVLRVLW